MNYKVEFSSKALKDLRSIPRLYQGKIIDKSEGLAIDPHPTGSLKLKGLNEEFWRIRIGDYRVIYKVLETVQVVDIRRIGHRKNIY